ncbi:hypothetical protein [Mollivirus kamchatka]|nr:hypothetical protein [Mollivirus kamchatka]
MSVKVTVVKSRPATQAPAGLVLPPQASDCLSSLCTVFARPLDVAPVPPRSNPQTTDPADVNNHTPPVEVPLRTTGQAVLHKFVQATQLSLRDYARLLHMAVTLACSEPSIVFLAQATDSFASRNKETLDGVLSAARAMHLRSCAMLRDCLARATSGKDPQAFSMCLDLIVEARLSVLAFLPLLERLAPANQAELFGPWKTAQGRDAFAGCISFGQTPSPLGPAWLTPRQLAYVVNKGRRCRQAVSFAFGHLDTAWQDMDALIGQQSNALQAARSWSNVCQP